MGEGGPLAVDEEATQKTILLKFKQSFASAKKGKNMKKNYTFKLKLNEEMAKKLSSVSKSEGLSIQNMLTQLVRQKVQYFERVKGNIQKSALNEVSLDDFEVEEI